MVGVSINNIVRHLWQKRRIFALGVTLIVALLLLLLLLFKTYPTSPKNQLPEGSIARLAAIAKSYLVAKNKILTQGENAMVLPKSPLTPSYRELFEKTAPRKLGIRNALREGNLEYTKFTTWLEVNKVRIVEGKVFLEATEHTKLYMRNVDVEDPLTPKFTTGAPEHIFTFIRNHDNQWILVKDEVPFEPGLTESLEEYR